MEIYKKDSFINAGDFNSISDIISYMGVIPIKTIMRDIERMVLKKCRLFNCKDERKGGDERKGYTPTLQELYAHTGKRLVSVVTNITKMKVEYYDYLSEPDLNCMEAAYMSCNLPPICQRIVYKGDSIVDGACMDNFPHRHIDDGKMKILAIVTTGGDFSRSDDNFVGYFYRLVASASVANMNLMCEMVGNNTTLIKIEWDVPQDSPMNVFRFSMKHKEKMDMFLRGYKTAEFKDHCELLHVPGWENK